MKLIEEVVKSVRCTIASEKIEKTINKETYNNFADIFRYYDRFNNEVSIWRSWPNKPNVLRNKS